MALTVTVVMAADEHVDEHTDEHADEHEDEIRARPTFARGRKFARGQKFTSRVAKILSEKMGFGGSMNW